MTRTALRRALALLAVVAAVVPAMVATGTTAAAGGAEGATPATAAARTEVALLRQTAWVREGGAFQLELLVGGAGPGDTVAVKVHRRVNGRIQFDGSVTGAEHGAVIGTVDDVPLTADGRAALAIATGADTPSTVVDGGGTAAATAGGSPASPTPPSSATAAPTPRPSTTVHHGTVRLREAGVYPISVEVRTADGAVSGGLTTWLVRLPEPDDTTDPLVTTLVVDVSAPIGHRPDGDIAVAPADAARISGLVDQLAAHDDLPLALQIRPETLLSLTATGSSTSPSEPPTPSSTTSTSAAPAAVSPTTEPEDDTDEPDLASRLAAATRRGDIASAPFADVDIAAFLAEAEERELVRQFTAGDRVLADVSKRRPDRRTVLVDDRLTISSIGWLIGRGGDRLVVPEERLEALDPERFPLALTQPFLVEVAGERLPAFQLDLLLHDHLRSFEDRPVLAAHELLAELAVLYFDRPGIARGVPVRLPATLLDEPRFTRALFGALEQTSKVRAVGWDELFAHAAPAPADGLEGESVDTLVREVHDTDARQLGTYPEELEAARAQLATFGALVGDDAPEMAQFEQLLLVTADRRLDRDDRRPYWDAIATAVDETATGIRSPKRTTITLTSRRAHIPLVVQNTTGRSVQVTIQLRSEKLRFPDGAERDVVLPEGETRLEIAVESRATGAFPLIVTITTPDGARRLTTSRFDVRSTAISGLGLVLSIGAGLFLLWWWASHFRTTRRNRRLEQSNHPTRRTREEQEALLRAITDL